MIIKCREEITESSDWVANAYIRDLVCCIALKTCYFVLQQL